MQGKYRLFFNLFFPLLLPLSIWTNRNWKFIGDGILFWSFRKEKKKKETIFNFTIDLFEGKRKPIEVPRLGVECDLTLKPSNDFSLVPGALWMSVNYSGIVFAWNISMCYIAIAKEAKTHTKPDVPIKRFTINTRKKVSINASMQRCDCFMPLLLPFSHIGIAASRNGTAALSKQIKQRVSRTSASVEVRSQILCVWNILSLNIYGELVLNARSDSMWFNGRDRWTGNFYSSILLPMGKRLCAGNRAIHSN